MSFEGRRPGEPTYRRATFQAIFEGERYLDNLLNDIAQQVVSKADYTIIPLTRVLPDTIFGPNVELIISIPDLDARLTIGKYRDGWHIKWHRGLARMGEAPTFDMKKEVFGDPNRNNAWTQETEKVPELATDLIKAIAEAKQKLSKES